MLGSVVSWLFCFLCVCYIQHVLLLLAQSVCIDVITGRPLYVLFAENGDVWYEHGVMYPLLAEHGVWRETSATLHISFVALATIILIS